MTPARAAALWAMPGRPRPTIATICTITPPSPSSIWFPNTCVIDHVPLRFKSITLFQPLGLNRRASCGNCPPALLTRMSTSCRPASASTLSRLRISTRSTVTGLPVAAVISAAAASSTSVRRAAITTVAPAAESPSAIARPRPVPPPVTSATEPASKSEANIVRRPFAGAESGAAEAAVGVSLIQPSWTPQGVIWRLR